MGGTAHRLEGERSSQYGQHSRVIECPSSVLHELRVTVLERFNSEPHGGSEVFGVLFGTHNDADVRITGFRALITDHEFAHPGELSDEECTAFASAMPAHADDAGASPVAAVGWFRSHPRSRLTLSARDLEIANTLFPKPWQVTLILRPGNSATTRARIFFRESAAPLEAVAGFQEFTLDPPGVELQVESDSFMDELAPGAEGSVTAAPKADAASAAVPADAPTNGTTAAAPASTAAPSHTAAPNEEVLPPVDAPPELASWTGSTEPAPETYLEQPPPPNASEPPVWSSTLLWSAALVAIAAVVGALYWFGRPQQLALRVFDSEGQLRISWDREAKPVSQGRNAHLEINDGGAKVWVELDGEQLRDGNVTYLRHSNNVTVRLVVPREGETPIEEAARFLGPMGQSPVAGASPQSGSASRVISPPRDLAPQRTAELVVAVPVKPAAEARPKFTAPPVASLASNKSAVPDLTPPPVVSRDSASAPVPTSTAAPIMHAQPATEKPAPPQIPAAVPPAPAASTQPSAAIVTPPVQNPVRPASAARPPAVQPASGRVIWIGRLQKNQTLIIKGKNSSTGTLIGELPSQPVKFSLSPGDLSSDGIVLYTTNSQYANNVVEPPGAENGWNRTIYTWNPKFANDVSVQETPSAQNGWSGVLRSRNPKISVIVIDWAVLN